MEDCKDHQMGLQHLAAQPQGQTPGGHNPWEAEAGLEAHLQLHHQQALVEIQALEHQRLDLRLPRTISTQVR
mgnify:CR=1 FL=1